MAEHTAVACGLPGQTLLQSPQFCGSVAVSTQAPPHSMYGAIQAKSHVPSAHVGAAFAGGMHTVPHLPQCAVLLITSTHEPLQSVVPPLQPEPHWPP